MDYSRTFEISAAGMNLERTRVDVAALNLANANTTRGADGTMYQALRVVARSVQVSQPEFPAQVELGLDGSAIPSVVPQASIELTGAPPRLVYDPGNPLADKKGYVAYAAVDNATEMVTMMGALRSYEANVAAMNMAKTLALRALGIGGSSS
jgi:flagellar basal-body rod protein FlgC